MRLRSAAAAALILAAVLASACDGGVADPLPSDPPPPAVTGNRCPVPASNLVKCSDNRSDWYFWDGWPAATAANESGCWTQTDDGGLFLLVDDCAETIDAYGRKWGAP